MKKDVPKDVAYKKKVERVVRKLKSRTFLDPTNDVGFKEIFRFKSLLKNFLNSLRHRTGCNLIVNLEMTYPEVADNLITLGLVRFDVRARTENRAEFNIEMQRATHRFLEDRMLLYNAALMIHGKRELDLAEKLKSMGKKRKLDRYEIPSVVSIWICNFKLTKFKDYADCIGLYSENEFRRALNEKRLPLSANGKEKCITIELPKFNKSLAQLKTDEDRWLYALKNMSSETQVPQLGNRYVEAAYEKLRVGKNPKLLKRMAENMVTEAEIETRMKDGERRGKTMGIEMALEVFQTLGISKAKLAVAKRLLSTCRCF